VFVGDVAAAIVKAIDSANYNGKTFELGGPSTYSFREILQQVSHETRRNRLVLPVPLIVAKIASTLLQFLPVPPLTPDQVTRLGEDNVLTGTLPGLAAFDITPTPVESVLPHYLDNYRPTHRQLRRIGKKNA
jgi:NADH dehydrogenase